MSSSSSDEGIKSQTKYMDRSKTVKIKDDSPVDKLEHKSAFKAKKSSNSVSKNISRKSSKAQSKKTTKRISSESEKSDFSRSASILNATQKKTTIHRIAQQDSKKSLKSNKSSKRRKDRRRDDSGSNIDFQEKQEEDGGLRSYSPLRN